MTRRKDGRPRSLPADQDLVTRQVKNEPPLKVPRGKIVEQVGPAMSGKTLRANAWMAEDPGNRRVVDGDRDEVQRLANEGYSVVLNLLSRD